MNIRQLLAAALIAAAGVASAAAPFVNLTPEPKQISVSEGELALPAGLKVTAAGLSEEMNAEVRKFITALNAATGLNAAVGAEGLIRVSANASLPEEGYTLNVTASGVTVEAATPAGLFYAFQTVKKLLPANVMAGVAEEKAYALPLVSIADEPRCEYRGFMLDCSRHFFPVEQVKRMLDVMSYYKLNKFHWHLTDDQGWRIEMPDYPRLQTVGATAPNVQIVDMHTKTEFWLNKEYGPYFYTQQELRDVVSYAEALHIEIIPEVDMPGHFKAVLAAYPEFSCTPDGAHSVADTGGIFADVMNVANPGAMQFTYDLCDVLIDIFPSPTIHIGGDECPTSAWESNAECQAKYKKFGLTSYRQLQSLFIKDVADYLAARGRKLGLWNESISESGADTQMVKSTGATIWCWTGADGAVDKAASLGLKAIYTPITQSGTNKGSFYINRSQSPNDPPANGSKNDDVKSVYNTIPFTTSAVSKHPETCYGVQGTFWAERVAFGEYLEYLALPRLLAIAEIGWTPQSKKDWTSFQKRMSADRELLDYNGYRYSTYHMLDVNDPVLPSMVMPKPGMWYQVVATGNNRAGRVWEIANEHHAISTHSSFRANRLWSSADVAAEADPYHDYQWFRFDEDPANPGRYAIVCKALPEGSLMSTPSATTVAGRWDYDPAARHYDFTFMADYYSAATDGTYNYALTSVNLADGQHLNCAMGGQGYAINVYTNPADANGGIFNFVPAEKSTDPGVDNGLALPLTFKAGKTYVFTNAAPAFEGNMLNAQGTAVGHTSSPWDNTLWTVTAAALNPDNSQTLSLTNLSTGGSILAPGATSGRVAKPVTLGADAADVRAYRYSTDVPEFMLAVGDDPFWCVPAESPSVPMSVRAGNNFGNGVSPFQGAVWTAREVTPVTFRCVDTEGNPVFSGVCGIPAGDDPAALAPAVRGYTFSSGQMAEGNVFNAVYTRTSLIFTVIGKLENGTYLYVEEGEMPLGSDGDITPLQLDGFTLVSAGTPEADAQGNLTLVATYSTEAHIGVARPMGLVTELQPGKAYLIRDAHADRNAFRCATDAATVSGAKSVVDQTPMFTWTLEENGKKFNVRNLATDTYVQALVRSTTATLGDKPYGFTFKYDSDHWTVKGANGMYWDGLDNLDLVGWDGGTGHPIEIYEFMGKPFHVVTINSVDSHGTLLGSVRKYALPGQTFVVGQPYRAGYTVTAIDGLEALRNLAGDATVTITYTSDSESSISEIEASAPAADAAVYDLQGRRVLRPARGLYIVNGCKTLLK